MLSSSLNALGQLYTEIPTSGPRRIMILDGLMSWISISLEIPRNLQFSVFVLLDFSLAQHTILCVNKKIIKKMLLTSNFLFYHYSSGTRGT